MAKFSFWLLLLLFISSFQNEAVAERLEDRTKPVLDSAKVEMDQLTARKKRSLDALEMFRKKAKAKNIIDLAKLELNPFLYKGQVVIVKTSLNKMISKNEGLFGYFLPQLMVSSVPSTKFAGQGLVVIAGKVIGSTKFQSSTLPHLKYVDSYICQTSTCDELFYWESQYRQDMDIKYSILNSKIERLEHEFRREEKQTATDFFNSVAGEITSYVIDYMNINGKKNLCDNDRCIYTNSEYSIKLSEGILHRPTLVSAQSSTPYNENWDNAYLRKTFEGAIDKFKNATVPDILKSRNYIATCLSQHSGGGPETNWQISCGFEASPPFD